MKPRITAVSLLILASAHTSWAQPGNIRDAFRQMPDTLMPYLTTNNRLDLIDFMDANMTARVENLLGGETTMTWLSDDSLSLSMSPALVVTMRLQLKSDTTGVVTVTRRYTIKEHYTEVVSCVYDASTWCPLSLPRTVSSTLTARDEELSRKPHF